MLVNSEVHILFDDNDELEFPKQTDSLFTHLGEPDDIADLRWRAGKSFKRSKHNPEYMHLPGTYADGYRMAAEIIARRIFNDGYDEFLCSNDLDILFYPIAYLYRHHIELRLKEIIELGNKRYDSDNTNDSIIKNYYIHNLKILWKYSRQIIDYNFSEISNHKVDLDIVGKLILELHKHDERSEGFRYHISRGVPKQAVAGSCKDKEEPKQTLAGIDVVNVRNFIDVMDRLANFLYCISLDISEMISSTE
jgi:hypothetical protein